MPGISALLLPVAVAAVPAAEARRLARLLDAGKQAAVLSQLKTPLVDLGLLEQALIGALTDRRLKAQGPLLWRMIRFVRNLPVKPPAPQPIDRTSSGVRSATATVPDGTVTLHTNVTLVASVFNMDTSDAYSLTFTSRPGTQTADSKRWMQFIWRMVEIEFIQSPGARPVRPKPLQMRLDKLDIPYFLTTDEASPFWSVDSADHNTAFYDEHFAPITRTPSTLVMYDAPSSVPNQAEVIYDVFNNRMTPTGERLNGTPESVVAHFRAKTYLVDGMDVLCRADIRLKWRFQNTGGPPNFAVIESSITKTSVLEPDHRLALVRQFPAFDFLPGNFGVPRPAAPFDLITPTGPASERFDDKVENYDRFKAVAAVAHAELIGDVIAPPGTSIGKPNSDAAGSRDIKRGLNYIPGKLSTDDALGETGYLDGNGAYQPKGVPIDRSGAVPSVAMILDGEAFSYGSPTRRPRRKDCAITVMRHEMLHAAHFELAILWLLKWRADFTSQGFLPWLDDQVKAKVLAPVDYAVVATYLGKRGKNATETLAYFEGFLAGLPWLEAPSIADLDQEELWPASIRELKGIRQYYLNSVLDDNDSKVIPALLQRARDVACGSLSQVQRDTTALWLRALRNPDSLDSGHSHAETVGAVKGYFVPLDDLLKELVKQFEQPCPQ